MPMERRSTIHVGHPATLQQRAGGDDRPPAIVGYAAVFYKPDDAGTEYRFSWWGEYRERILPGAFDGVLSDDARGLYNHNADLVLGRTKVGTCRLSVDGIGMRYEIDPPNTTFANDLLESIRRKDVTGSSFAFDIDPEGTNWLETQEGTNPPLVICEITRVAALYDVGPVTFPAYESTTAGIRSAKASEEAARSGYARWKERNTVGGNGVPIDILRRRLALRVRVH